MGGGGTTYSVTEMPSEVQNLLGSSASKIGGMQNSDALNIGNFFGANPQQTAGFTGFFDWAGNQGFQGAGRRPDSESLAQSMAQYLPSQMGATPSSFYGATGMRPAASQMSMDFLPALQGTAGEVSSRYYTGPSAWEQYAGGLASQVTPYAGQALAAFDPVRQQAGQVPQDFGQLMAQALFEGQNLRPLGLGLATSPSLAAAQQAFERNIQPGIENQAATAGLGRSTALTNSLASAEAQYMLPLVQEELGREFQGNLARYQALQDVGMQSALAQERGIERGTNVGLQQAQAMQNVPQTMLASSQMLNQLGQQDAARQLEAANAEERGTVRRTQSIETAINTLQTQGQYDLARQLELATAEERALSRTGEASSTSLQALLGLGGAETARAQQQYSSALQLDELYRNQIQQQYDSQYNDYLRRQALSEQSLFGPLGQIIPSAFGQRVSQSGGGMFK